jgi:inorganic pyrophosphatase
VAFGEWDWDTLANDWDAEQLSDWGLNVWKDDMTNNENYEGLDALSKLDKFMDAEIKRMFLVYDSETFTKVVNWFNKLQAKHNLEDNNQVILKLMENENI